MLTSFTLISGIRKNTGCKVWREGLGGRQDCGNYPLMLHQTADERGGGRRRGKRKLCRGSHRLQGWEERRKGLRQEETGGLAEEKRDKREGGDWAKLEGFLSKSQWINEVKLMKSKGGWSKQAHKCWLFLSSLLPCLPPMSPLWYSTPTTPLFTLPFVLLPFKSLTPALLSCLLSTSSSSSHLLSSPAPSTPSVSLITSPLHSPSPPVYPYSQLVQYRSLWATVRQIGREKGGSADTEGNTLRAAVHAVHCCSTPVCKFHRACEGKTINWTGHVTCGWKELIEMDIS